MGIYDREYYRDSTRGAGFFGGPGSAVRALIGINVAVFLAQWFTEGPGPSGPGPLVETFEVSARAVFQRLQVWRLLTYAFLHGDLIHILFNMYLLYIAGRDVENFLGRVQFTLFYLTAAVASGFLWALLEALNPYGSVDSVAIGASGAVMATLVVFAMYYPRREFLLFFVLPVQAWALVLIALGFDLLGLLQQWHAPGGEAIAFAAHLGGAGYGYLFKRFDLRWSSLLAGRPFGGNRRLKIFAPEAPPAPRRGRRHEGPEAEAGAFDEHLDAKLDAILAKIAREGSRDTLTDEERRVLELASRRARSRRGGPLR